jgi:hypothetical protein
VIKLLEHERIRALELFFKKKRSEVSSPSSTEKPTDEKDPNGTLGSFVDLIG